VGSVSRSHIWRRISAIVSWILQNYRAKLLMCYILLEPLMSYYLDRAHDIWGKSTRSERVDGYIPNLIYNIIKHIKPFMLHECIK
jgi:hypothetical protein